MNYRANLPSKISLLSLVLSVVAGCHGVPQAKPLNDTSNTIQASATQIATSTQEIRKQCNLISDVVPEPARAIVHEADQLDEVKLKLESAKVEIDASGKSIIAKDHLIAKQAEEIKTLENERYGLISRWLAIVAVLSLVGSVASIFVLSSPRLAVACGVLFSVAVAAQWLLSYAVIIGIVTLVMLVVGVVWVIVKERKATSEIVQTVEAIKPHISTNVDFKASANAIQSVVTRRIVDTIKGLTKS